MAVRRALRTLTTCIDVAVFLWRRHNSTAQNSAPAADATSEVSRDRKPVLSAEAATRARDLTPESMQTVTFGLDGQNYAIDLTDESAAELRTTLARYIGAGRPVGRQARKADAVAARSRAGRPAPSNGRDAPAIRAWARAHGHRISDRGPIPATVRQAYDARQQGRAG